MHRFAYIDDMKKKEIKQELISIGQVAKILGVHIDTLRRWDRQGKLKSIRLGLKGRRRYKISDIQNLLNEKSIKISRQN